VAAHPAAICLSARINHCINDGLSQDAATNLAAAAAAAAAAWRLRMLAIMYEVGNNSVDAAVRHGSITAVQF